MKKKLSIFWFFEVAIYLEFSSGMAMHRRIPIPLQTAPLAVIMATIHVKIANVTSCTPKCGCVGGMTLIETIFVLPIFELRLEGCFKILEEQRIRPIGLQLFNHKFVSFTFFRGLKHPGRHGLLLLSS